MPLTIKPLRTSIEDMRERGGYIVERYPTETKDGKRPAPFASNGLGSPFRAIGRVEVARRAARPPIVRYRIRDAR